MSNVEARVARTLSPPGGDPFELRGEARRGALAAKGTRRRRLLAAALFAGVWHHGHRCSCSDRRRGSAGRPDWTDRSGADADVRAAVAVDWHQLFARPLSVRHQKPDGALPPPRDVDAAVRLRRHAGREGPSVELAIVPLVGAISFVFGCWIEHLIGARLARSDVIVLRPPSSAPGASSRALARLLLSNPACGLCPIGFIDDGACSDDDVDEVVPLHCAGGTSAALPVLGTLDGGRADGVAEVVIVPGCEVLPRDPAPFIGWARGKSW
jgi:hypothetical protein